MPKNEYRIVSKQTKSMLINTKDDRAHQKSMSSERKRLSLRKKNMRGKAREETLVKNEIFV